ncbi:F0F1 ATP synthase subunit A [Candidatus Falkowbacteria bacterium]|nr:F0F1 ATP synthase subunit A [Candidatus Falkowbacteria bacterium]NCT54385.1 F0F1 ATP synthase subunit A [Candidatus Falkowbacteria bacterium]
MGLNISLAPEVLFHIGSFTVTNTYFWFFCLWLFLVVGAIIFKSRIKLMPGKFQNLVEMAISGAYDFTESIIGPGKKAERAFPLVATMFFFILISNLLAYIPGQAAITINTSGGIVPLFRSIVADYGFVFMMTISVVILIQIIAIATSGPFAYIGKFINLRSPLKAFLGIMDLIGEIAKIVSLSFRLFGNIFAGEVLAAVMLFLAPFFVPLPFMFLGLLTAVVQAFVFSVLTLVFISMASEVSPEKATA